MKGNVQWISVNVQTFFWIPILCNRKNAGEWFSLNGGPFFWFVIFTWRGMNSIVDNEGELIYSRQWSGLNSFDSKFYNIRLNGNESL